MEPEQPQQTVETNGAVSKIGDAGGPRPRLVDHPLVAWLLENGCIAGLATLHMALPQLTSRRSLPSKFVWALASGLVINDGAIMAQRILVNHVYSHIPFFSKAHIRRAQYTWRELREWFMCNFVSDAIGAGIIAVMSGFKKPKDSRRRVFQVRPLRFLALLAIGRVVVDLAFYTVHRALHTRLLYPLHKRHHEHVATGIPTNFHFTVTDLMLEGFTPLFCAFLTLELLRANPSYFEQGLLVGYIQWFEIGSHSGKPVPTVTYFPPLAPFYRLLLGDVDKRNIEFHDKHHAWRNCNYGITQWLDHLLGTAKFCAQDKGT